jgi:16S rRNA (adenine1518-N6/adenine1519-N6)-dimethyltransferase
MELFEQHGFHPRTDLGQNFLIDLNIIEFIVREAQLGPDDVVLEVGAGTGGMTSFLAQQAGEVVSVEVDTNMHRLAQSVLEGYSNVTLLHTDALKNKNRLSPLVVDEVERKLAAVPGGRLKLVANLPYSVATPVVSNLVATEISWEMMVITIQRELAQRMAAKPARNHYGALSAWLQAQCRVKVLKRLPPSVFWPRPKVDSAVVRITPAPQRRRHIVDREFFHDFVRRVFHQRRKLMRGVIAGMYRKQVPKAEIDEVLAGLEVPPQARAEETSVETLVAISNHLFNRIHVAAQE